MKEEGFSLVVVLVFIAMLSSLAIVAVKMSGLTAISMYGKKEGEQVYYIAEAAYQHALFNLNQNTAWRGDLIDQPFAGGTYSLNVSQASLIDDLIITAVGSIGGTERTIVRTIPPPVKPFIIVAFAGDGTQNFGGDYGPAVNAYLNKPKGVTKNAAGDVFISDTDNCRIRKVDKTTLIITTSAGTGACQLGGDGGVATAAGFKKPGGLAFDSAGNLYIADTDNHRIRKINGATTIVTTAAGSDRGFSGDNDPATSAQLDKPMDVAVDISGNIYIADTDNCRIRKVDTDGIITTYAGTDTCGWNSDGLLATSTRFDKPKGLALDASGNLYVADTDNHRIRKIDKVTKIVTTVAGTSGGFAGDGGPAVNAKLNKPEGVSVNQVGTLYIADTSNHRIRKVNSNGTITTHAGIGTAGNTGDGGLATDAQLNKPNRVIAYDDVDGHLQISDTNNHRIREITNVY